MMILKPDLKPISVTFLEKLLIIFNQISKKQNKSKSDVDTEILNELETRRG